LREVEGIVSEEDPAARLEVPASMVEELEAVPTFSGVSWGVPDLTIFALNVFFLSFTVEN
jgi:hypothetical protein